MNRWYVVHTHSRCEDRALHHLRRQGFRTYLPKYLKRRRHARKTEWIPSPLFPRYLFVNMDIDAERWRAICSTVGVVQLVCHGNTPTPVPSGVVESIQSLEDDRGLTRINLTPALRKGDRVNIVDGAFADYEGIFECTDDRDRVVVLLDLLGREVKVSLRAEAIAG